MSYVFDSSSLLEAMKRNATAVLAGNFTLDLARYELMNALWKQHALLHRIGADELNSLVRVSKEVMNVLEILGTGCHEEEIIKLSSQLKLTFYDASYVFHAVNTRASLVTEDERLIDSARSLVRAVRFREIL
jgi:predicted nucleic acid-binding protein